MSSQILHALGDDVHFSHKILYQKKEFDLRIYSNGIAFLPLDKSEETKAFVWPVILNVSYSPTTDPRTAVLMKTSVPGSESLILQLSGGSVEERLAEQAKLKGIVSQFRKNIKTKTAETKEKPAASATPAFSAPSTLIDNINSIDKNILEVIKKNLLKNNKELAKNYTSLVEQNLITSEDFWMKNADLVVTYYNDEILYKKKKGVYNNLWDDIVVKAGAAGGKPGDGKVVINLTPDLKVLIFKRYPKVKKIFDKEVPLKMYEEKFWELFFRFEYYSINHKNNAGALNMRENIFANYEEEDDNDKENREEGERKRKKEISEAEIESYSIKKKKLQYVSSHPEIDLSQTFNDSIAYKKSFDNNEKPEKNSDLIKRFNEDSFFISPIQHQQVDKEEITETVKNIIDPSSKIKSKNIDRDTEDFKELFTGSSEVYYKFNLINNTNNSNNIDTSGFSSAFSSGFSLNTMSSKYFMIKSPNLINLPIPIRENQLVNNSNFLQKYLPNANRSEKYFYNELPKIFKLQSISNYTGVSSANKDIMGTERANLVDPSLAITSSFDILPEEIKPVIFIFSFFLLNFILNLLFF